MAALRARVAQLDAARRAIESELGVLAAQLGPAGMTGPLVDADGFPRADVDVMAVRHARQQVVMRRNDLKSAMGELAGALEALHALGPTAAPAPLAGVGRVGAAGGLAAAHAAGGDSATLAPFAWVDSVTPGSPASDAGLAVSDRIVALGPLRGAPVGTVVGAAPSLADVAAVVRSSEDTEVAVVVRRGGVDVALRLTPRRWAGPGLLGCHVLPAGVE